MELNNYSKNDNRTRQLLRNFVNNYENENDDDENML